VLDSFTFWLIVLAVLIAYLCVSVGLRLAKEARQRASEEQFTGTPFNVSVISPQIQQLRRYHLAAAHSRPPHSFYRTGLMAAARRMVTSLSYFRRPGPEHENRPTDEN